VTIVHMVHGSLHTNVKNDRDTKNGFD